MAKVERLVARAEWRVEKEGRRVGAIAVRVAMEGGWWRRWSG